MSTNRTQGKEAKKTRPQNVKEVLRFGEAEFRIKPKKVRKSINDGRNQQKHGGVYANPFANWVCPLCSEAEPPISKQRHQSHAGAGP